MAETETPTPVRSQAATRENGYVNGAATSPSAWWAFTDQTEESPELRWPACVPVYDRMRRTDAQVLSVLRAVKSPLQATTWRLEQGAADAKVTEFISRNLGLPIKGISESEQTYHRGRGRDRFSFAEHLRLSLLQLDFGHAVFEQVYRIENDQVWLRKLAPRAARTIAKWNVARDGGLISIEQKAPAGTPTAGNITMPISRLVAYSHEREGAEWWGQSLLRSAYKHWLIKDRLLRVDAQSIERNGMGLPVHKTGERASTEKTEEAMKAGLELAQGVRAGDSSGASLAPGDDLELLGVSGTLPAAMKSIQYHDDQIGKSVLAHFLNLGRQTGSWALGSTFADFFVASLNGIGNATADVITHHVIEDLVDLNFGPEVAAPRVVFDDLAGQDQALAYAIKALVDAGVLHPDASVETYLRTAYKLPQPDPNGTAPPDPNGDPDE